MYDVVPIEKPLDTLKIFWKNTSIGIINPLWEKTKISLPEALKEKEKSKMFKRIQFYCQEKICIGAILM